MRLRSTTAAVLLATALPLAQARAGSLFVDEEQHYALNWGLDAYYSFLSFNGSLLSPQEGENVLDAQAEDSIYLYLLGTFFVPRTLNLELSVNPLPLAGVYLKTEQRELYERGTVLTGLNIIESVTDGFPEPGAVSLFVGNNAFLVNFETGETEGIGFGGLLVSYGNYHIVNNTLVADSWVELEAKLKGISLSEQRRVSFSFRLGAKLHDHRDIRDSFYASIIRSHLDRTYYGWSPLQNSELELRSDFSVDGLKPARLLALFGKKMPSPSGEYVFSLAVGVQGLFRAAYSGDLADDTVETGWTFLLRPNVSF